MTRVHIVGAGMAGLSAAVRLAAAGLRVTVYESSGHAGGRCRSFHDGVLDAVIDNGNHLLLSGNHSAMAYLDEIGARETLTGPRDASFPFVDLNSGARWTVRPNRGPIPWWILCAGRRPPGAKAGDFLAAGRLRDAAATVSDALGGSGELYETFWEPLAVAALNTPADQAAARPLWQVLKETFAYGSAACRPLVARNGLSASLVDPALARLATLGADIRFAHRLKAVRSLGGRISHLEFAETGVVVQPADTVILALPPLGLKPILPEISVPTDSHPIVNIHYRLAAPVSGSEAVSILGLVGGIAHWLFVRGDIASVTVSAADALAEQPAESIGARVWDEVSRALGITGEVPPFRVLKERRATFSQTPAAMCLRARTRTDTSNLFLAGDWTDTGLPATIESAIRSGHAAAEAVQAS